MRTGPPICGVVVREGMFREDPRSRASSTADPIPVAMMRGVAKDRSLVVATGCARGRLPIRIRSHSVRLPDAIRLLDACLMQTPTYRADSTGSRNTR